MSEAPEGTWRKGLLAADATIERAIHNLDESHLQIAIVVLDSAIMIGTITDGDIRRGLLRGLGLKDPIETLIQREAFVVTPEMSRETALHLMQANRLRQLPVVDSERRVVGLHLWDELSAPSARPNAMVIMAGGLGSRLRPHTDDCPKPLLRVAGRPILEHIVERAKAERVHHFLIAINYLGHMIEDYFGDGSRWQVHIDYLREESPGGTAGAISLLNPRPTVPFLVSNGDVLTDIRYGELLDFHCRHGACATMAVRQHEWRHPFGVVHTKGVDIIGFEEKPIARSHVNAGVYVLEPAALDVVRVGEHCDMPTLFSRLQERAARTIVYPMHEPWLDLGTKDDWERAR